MPTSTVPSSSETPSQRAGSLVAALRIWALESPARASARSSSCSEIARRHAGHAAGIGSGQYRESGGCEGVDEAAAEVDDRLQLGDALRARLGDVAVGFEPARQLQGVDLRQSLDAGEDVRITRLGKYLLVEKEG